MENVFITGYPHSGTTIMRIMVANSGKFVEYQMNVLSINLYKGQGMFTNTPFSQRFLKQKR